MLDRLPDWRRIANHDHVVENASRDAIRRSFQLLAETEGMVLWSRRWRECAAPSPPEPDGLDETPQPSEARTPGSR